MADMKAPEYWKTHYVVVTDPNDIERSLEIERFVWIGESHELLRFTSGRSAPNVLLSQGSGGHPYVFAELAYLIHRAGYNVFVMPKHGGLTVDQLLRRHRGAVRHIRERFGPRIGVYAEGLGAYVTFYLALAGRRSRASSSRTARQS